MTSPLDRLTARRSRKHIGSDRIPTSAHVLRRVSWILLVRESGQQLWTHCCAVSGTSKWNLASREPTTTPPRAWNARAIGMSASGWRRNASRGDQDSVRTERAGPSGLPSHPTRPDRAACVGMRLRSRALRPSHSPSGDCGSIQSIFLLPVKVAIGTPSRNAIRVEAVAETRSPKQTTPVRFSGSAALSVTIAPSAGARRTLRSVSTASGSAYCSPVKPATNRPPRISPRASRRWNSRKRSRHGTVIDSRASSGLNTTP